MPAESEKKYYIYLVTILVAIDDEDVDFCLYQNLGDMYTIFPPVLDACALMFTVYLNYNTFKSSNRQTSSQPGLVQRHKNWPRRATDRLPMTYLKIIF